MAEQPHQSATWNALPAGVRRQERSRRIPRVPKTSSTRKRTSPLQTSTRPRELRPREAPGRAAVQAFGQTGLACGGGGTPSRGRCCLRDSDLRRERHIRRHREVATPRPAQQAVEQGRRVEVGTAPPVYGPVGPRQGDRTTLAQGRVGFQRDSRLHVRWVRRCGENGFGTQAAPGGRAIIIGRAATLAGATSYVGSAAHLRSQDPSDAPGIASWASCLSNQEHHARRRMGVPAPGRAAATPGIHPYRRNTDDR